MTSRATRFCSIQASSSQFKPVALVMGSQGEQLAKKIKGEPGFQEMIQQIADTAAQSANAAWAVKTSEANDKWVQQLAMENAKWEGRTKELIADVNKNTEEKIAVAIQASEARSDELFQKFKKEIFAEVNSVKSDVNVSHAGVGIRQEVEKLSKTVEEFKKNGVIPAVSTRGGANSQPGIQQQINHKINSSKVNKDNFRERDRATLQFSGKEAVDKSDAASIVERTLSNLGIGRTFYTISGPPRGFRFSVKFKRGALHYDEPGDAAHHVKQSFKPKRDGDLWKKVVFTREADNSQVEYEFSYDQASNQTIKEIITKKVFGFVKGKGDDFEMFKKDGTIFKKFTCIARVIVGYKEDSFQVKWVKPEVFTEVGLDTAEIEKELRSEYAKWCL